MEVNCKIIKDLVLEEISRLTGYVGKSSNEVDVDNIVITSDEDTLILSFYSEAIHDLYSVVRGPGRSMNDEEKETFYSFDMPPNFDINATNSIEKKMLSFVVNRICSKWFNISKKEDMIYYINESERNLGELRGLLGARCKPIRRTASPF